MSFTLSPAGSWSRSPVLWVQVASLLDRGPVSAPTIENIRTELFRPDCLTSVGIIAAADEHRVAQWNLCIDWQRHATLLRTDRIVSKSYGFGDDQISTALGVAIRLIEDHFEANPHHGRGWTFDSTLDFADACRRIGVAPGRQLRNHPDLRREGGVAIPGLEEASVEVFGLD